MMRLCNKTTPRRGPDKERLRVGLGLSIIFIEVIYENFSIFRTFIRLPTEGKLDRKCTLMLANIVDVAVVVVIRLS